MAQVQLLQLEVTTHVDKSVGRWAALHPKVTQQTLQGTVLQV